MLILSIGGIRVFIYGQDIPLDDVSAEESAEAAARKPVEPAEYLFDYGKNIFPDTSAD